MSGITFKSFFKEIFFFLWFFNIFFVYLHSLHTEALLAGGADEGGDLYIGKSVILRFVLDVLESGSFTLIVKNIATMTLMGM